MLAEPKSPEVLPEPDWREPSRLSGLVFFAKVQALRSRRVMTDLLHGPPVLRRGGEGIPACTQAESRTPLKASQPDGERIHQLGKIQNLRQACRALDGLVIPAGATFSFWRAVGPPTAWRGYVPGRMLKEGCLMVAVGGGLCQLSNALYDCALQAGCQILERHAHSRVVPGSAAARGRDATVAWNYVDLRFRAERPLRLQARLEGPDLVVRLLGAADAERPAESNRLPAPATSSAAARSCATCHQAGCHHHIPSARRGPPPGRQVFLVDEAWPEFLAHVRAVQGPEDRLGAPLSGTGVQAARHAWPQAGFERTAGAPLTAIGRSLALRQAGAGAAARRAELQAAEALAARLGRLLTYDVETVTVAQSYLPYLWRAGLLGGRTVSVLMSRLPMAELQDRLDAAARRRPETASLTDFRAPDWMAEAESEALAACAHIITPHAAIAALFGARAYRLAWATPQGVAVPAAPQAAWCGRIAFPGPALARKGAFAVREAARRLDLEVVTAASAPEGAGFWDGVRCSPPQAGQPVDAVVLPAVIEHQPRRLLAALAAGVPVIASPACGLDPQPGLTLMPPDDSAALIEALQGLRDQRPGAGH